MAEGVQQTVFALDCGATNWRLYRCEYLLSEAGAGMVGEPQPASLTSFVDRKLPAVLCLDSVGTGLEALGEVAQQLQEDERTRERVRDYFKPCIGAYLESDPLPSQKKYTHAEALLFTKMLLDAVIKQIRQEKWRGQPFDERVQFTFSYPVHWRYEHGGEVLEDFKRAVLECFEEPFDQVRFVPEPVGAILCLQHGGLLATPGGQVTLIIDVGGSTTDIVAGEMDAATGRLRYIGRHGGPFGGGLYDFELAKHFADDIGIPSSALADDPSALLTLRVYGQRLKESLSRQRLHSADAARAPQRMITIVMHDGTTYRRMVTLEEARFRSLTAHLEATFETFIDTALRKMSIPENRIGQAVLVGGGAQLFTIIEHLRDRFGEERVVLADNSEEIVVRGVGLEYGAALAGAQTDIDFEPTAAVETVGAGSLSGAPQSPWRLERSDGSLVALQEGLTSIGRGETNTFRIEDPKASRFHAQLRCTDDSLEVTDLGSTNGTYVNGTRLAPNEKRLLNGDDEIRIGQMRLVCRR